MANRRGNVWDEDFDVYTPGQVESVLEYCDIEVMGDTSTHFLALCPFHGNTDTPAFAVDKYQGLWTCFNPSCQNSGTLEDVIRRTKGLNPFQAARIILRYKDAETVPFADRLAEIMKKSPDFIEYPQSVLDRLYEDFDGSKGQAYMRSRGFTDDTLEYFRVGYSSKQDMVIVPMHDPNGMPVGFIGRSASHTDKRFKNTNHLPKSKTAWNFHRAKRQGEVVIVCESSYDAMRIHQAGYPNVIALLGGHVTADHIAQIGRHFSKVIIMTDFDKKQYRPNCRMCNYQKCRGHRPGRDLGRSIVRKLSNTKALWAAYDDNVVYPNGAKDATDMTDDEIRQCLRNAVSNMEYERWDVEEVSDEVLAS